MDPNNTILQNLEEHFNVSGADAFNKLAEIPQYLLEDQLILASAHLFVKNIASIYMRWLFLQPFSDPEGHQVVGSFAPFMKVRGLSIDEGIEMWKQESKAALKLAHGDSERETRMKMKINKLRREIESEYFKWHNAAKKGPEVFSFGCPDSLGNNFLGLPNHGEYLTSNSIAEMANETYSVRKHRDFRAAGSDQEPGVKGSYIKNDAIETDMADVKRSDVEGSSSSEETQQWRRSRERTARHTGRLVKDARRPGRDTGRLGGKVISKTPKGSYRPYNSNSF
ncbi:uncharacterized protein B0J16DRAFT_383334 [Fusarium flagelliforme]|uniref:uncharacterized protein n=1 Tax=Fusarium flagelliforme TaxID=2675880 RepID=UPI001E8E323C|nr:uncharacterized protein B0J16DRAFT_383334 [Fusarium flagelliforme]KAH7189469.1 hypothetical protein B0J16DRAFT_383334 [Fusarium flagelliforme]